MMNEDQKSIVSGAMDAALHRAARRVAQKSGRPYTHYRIEIDDGGGVELEFSQAAEFHGSSWIPLEL